MQGKELIIANISFSLLCPFINVEAQSWLAFITSFLQHDNHQSLILYQINLPKIINNPDILIHEMNEKKHMVCETAAFI